MLHIMPATAVKIHLLAGTEPLPKVCVTLSREAATGNLAPGMSFSHLQHLTPAGAETAPVQAVTREFYLQHCTGQLTLPKQN